MRRELAWVTLVVLSLSGCSSGSATVEPGPECPDGRSPIGNVCPLDGDGSGPGSTTGWHTDSPGSKPNRFEKGLACLKAVTDDKPRNDPRLCRRSHHSKRRHSTTAPVQPPPWPAAKSCVDVTSYDYNWGNDVLCTRPDGTSFYTSYDGAQAFLGY